MGSEFHNKRIEHYEHNNNAFSLSPRVVSVKKNLKKFIHWIYRILYIMIILSLSIYGHNDRTQSPKLLTEGHEFHNLERGLHRYYNHAFKET